MEKSLKSRSRSRRSSRRRRGARATGPRGDWRREMPSKTVDLNDRDMAADFFALTMFLLTRHVPFTLESDGEIASLRFKAIAMPSDWQYLVGRIADGDN